ncbi:MAG: hypothetical protein J0H65_14510 [Rhizobiales bacterium]|nr:hypothetical protein [Hyphomicrobiales bacterium]
MSIRLFISSLTAAFTAGTAFGLAIDQTITKAHEAYNQAEIQSFHQDKPASETPEAPGSSLECRESSTGVHRCWPKAAAPDPDQDLTCIESGDQSLCFTTPPAKGPKLGL